MQCEIALRQWQTSERRERLRDSFRIALQKQHVAGTQANLADFLADRPALPCERQQVQSMAPSEHRLCYGAAHQPGRWRHDGFHEMDIVRFQVARSERGRTGKAQPGFMDDRLDRLGAAFQQEPVVNPDGIAQFRFDSPPVAALQSNGNDFPFTGGRKQISYRCPGQTGLARYDDLGDVSFYVKQAVAICPLAFTGRDQTPPAQSDKDRAGERDDQADRCEVEHAVRRVTERAAIGRDNDVRRCTDERDETAQ